MPVLIGPELKVKEVHDVPQWSTQTKLHGQVQKHAGNCFRVGVIHSASYQESKYNAFQSIEVCHVLSPSRILQLFLETCVMMAA